MAKTIRAMKKISDVREKRQERFWEARMAKAKGVQVASDRKELEQQIHLIKAPDSLLKDKAGQKAKAEKVAAEEAEDMME